MPARSTSLLAVAMLLAGCATGDFGPAQARDPGRGCPMNFRQFCEVSRPGAPDAQRCRCIRDRAIMDMLGRDY